MTKRSAAAPLPASQEFDYSRLGGMTCMPPEGLQQLFAEGLLPPSVELLPARAGLFVRLCLVRLLKSGVDPEIIPAAAEMLAALFAHADPLRNEAWLLLFDASREIVTERSYLIHALAQAKNHAIVILDIGEAWRATA